MNQEGALNLANHIYSLKYYPISLDVKGKNCLVVGGGSVGARKAITLAQCGAKVNVVSPMFSEEFSNKIHTILNNEYTNIYNEDTNICAIKCVQKHYDRNDLDSMFLVIGATDNSFVNRQIAADAKARQILCNIADFPEGSSFVLPSIVQRGELVITISTSGNSPALAKKLRKELALQFGEEYATFLTLMGNIRKILLSQEHSQNSLQKSESEKHASIFRDIVYSDLLEKISIKDQSGIEKTLLKVLCNHGCSHLYSKIISIEE